MEGAAGGGCSISCCSKSRSSSSRSRSIDKHDISSGSRLLYICQYEFPHLGVVSPSTVQVEGGGGGGAGTVW